jgi:vacuolar protein sorting-associated protein 41
LWCAKCCQFAVRCTDPRYLCGCFFLRLNNIDFFFSVLDPKLPHALYARVLRKMLDELEEMKTSPKDPIAVNRVLLEAESHFLNALLAWGTIRALEEHVELFQYQSQQDASFEVMVRLTTESTHYREHQTAAGYLDPSSQALGSSISGAKHPVRPVLSGGNSMDSLYKIDEMISVLAPRVSVRLLDADDENSIAQVPSSDPFTGTRNSKIVLDALARLLMMKGSYEDAIKCFLLIGALHSKKTLEEIEEEGLDRVNRINSEHILSKDETKQYSFVLHLLAKHHLHQSLLEKDLLPDAVNSTPICSLIRLVGLELAGDFLIEHCITPQQKKVNDKPSTSLPYGSKSSKTVGERRGTLPLNLVVDQLTPKLVHWYLHLVFVRKPEIYVKFPSTANPSPVIASLHKKHLDLHIKYAGPNRDSAMALAGIEAYRVAERTTPLLSFLQAILQLGGIGAIDVAKLLQIERRGGSGVSQIFALELAYILENYGDNSEAEAMVILELNLEGALSLMLAVAYAQRTKEFSSVLWEKLIAHCLATKSEDGNEHSIDGSLFGSLLEAAALNGADLAHLVAQIPPGMQVEGLRPRLVAAVADYRMKVKLHATSSDVAVREKAMLLEEASQRFRRGMRWQDSSVQPGIPNGQPTKLGEDSSAPAKERDRKEPVTLPGELRPKERPNQYHRTIVLPIR